ncbi:hypothetical protein ACLB2K_065658 [Fragaria x ananassa]
MSTSLKKLIPTETTMKSNQELAQTIAKTLADSGLQHLRTSSPSLLSNLNPHITHLVLSDPILPPQSCLTFFNFLRRNPSLKPLRPNLQAHLTLFCRLHQANRFAQMKNVVNTIVHNDRLQCQVSHIVSLIETGSYERDSVKKLFDMLFRVYVNTEMFEEAFGVFDHVYKNGLEIEERSCFAGLLALKKCNEVDKCLCLFDRMREKGLVTVYSMTLVINELCKRGELERAKRLMGEMRGIGVEANVYTYNTIAKAYIERKDFGGVSEVLGLMKRSNVEYNVATYTLLIDWYGSCEKIGDVEKVFDEMHERGVEPDVYVYTSMINWNCRGGNLKRALFLFDEMTERRLVPNGHTYGALINGACKAGQMEMAEILLKEMQGKGIALNRVVCNTLIDGYCRKGMVDEAQRFRDVMEKKGLKADVYTYCNIARGLFKLNRNEEAKRSLLTMAERDVAPNSVCFTTLIDIYCKEGDFAEAKRVFQEMERKGERPNNVTYNVFIDGYTKKGKMKEAHEIKEEMECKGLMADSYTYSSLIHGECVAGNMDAALTLFDEMLQKGLTRNVVTYTIIISGLSKVGRKEAAFKLYDDMKKLSIIPDDRVYHSLNLNELVSVAALLWKGKDSSTVVKELLFGGYYGSSERKGVVKFQKRLQTINGCSLSYHLPTPPEGVLLFRWNIGTVRLYASVAGSAPIPALFFFTLGDSSNKFDFST